MNYSLSSDFQAFIDSRLNCAGYRLKDNADYKRENDNIENATQELRAAMSPEMALTLSDIEESYLEQTGLQGRFEALLRNWITPKGKRLC